MTDINEPLTQPADRRVETPAARKASPAREASLLALAELLFFAYRDFTRDPDTILKDFGFGRAHHRVLHFVNCHSGLRVADLLDALNITKQSLGRVLKQLIDQGYIVQEAGSVDRRERLLERVWGGEWFGDDHVVDVHIGNLRAKLGDDPRAPRYVRTIRGVGYRMGEGQ